MLVRKIEIKEKEELEPIIVGNPELIEEGMGIVAHQLTTPTGPLDILAVDEEGALAIIELKNEIDEEENQLLQALRYYDWCFENRAWLANAYKEKSIDPQKDPRLILVAPDFSESLKRLAKFLAVEVELYRYQAIELSSGEKTIICNQLFFEERPEVPIIASIPQSVKRIKDDFVKNLYTECLNKLKELGLELQPRAKDTISGYYKGKRIIRIYPKNEFFGVRLQMADSSWSERIRIRKNEDWEEFVDKHLRSRIEDKE
jgi:hypothetical protein